IRANLILPLVYEREIGKFRKHDRSSALFAVQCDAHVGHLITETRVESSIIDFGVTSRGSCNSTPTSARVCANLGRTNVWSSVFNPFTARGSVATAHWAIMEEFRDSDRRVRFPKRVRRRMHSCTRLGGSRSTNRCRASASLPTKCGLSKTATACVSLGVSKLRRAYYTQQLAGKTVLRVTWHGEPVEDY